MSIAQSMGVQIPDVWITWALGALVPGLVSILTVPLIVARFFPPSECVCFVRLCVCVRARVHKSHLNACSSVHQTRTFYGP